MVQLMAPYLCATMSFWKWFAQCVIACLGPWCPIVSSRVYAFAEEVVCTGCIVLTARFGRAEQGSCPLCARSSCLSMCQLEIRDQGWICRLPGARENITVCDVPPSRPQPIGSRKQLEPRSRSAVHRGENFVG